MLTGALTSVTGCWSVRGGAVLRVLWLLGFFLACCGAAPAAFQESGQSGGDGLRETNALRDRGVRYAEQGKHTEAARLLERALSEYERTLGGDHPVIAKCLFHLGVAYASQGRFAEAETAYLRAASIQERSLDPKHLDFADVLYALGALYVELGRMQEAERLVRQSLQIEEDVLGKNHPSLALALLLLAEVHREGGRYGEAERELNRAVTIAEADRTANRLTWRSSWMLEVWYAVLKDATGKRRRTGLVP